MCRFLETIRIEAGKPLHLPYHQARLNATFARFFPDAEPPLLEHAIQIPASAKSGTWKCRVLYDHKMQEVTFLPYREKVIETLKLIQADDLDYSFKFAGRNALEKLLESRGGCDDVLIVKEGFITDTSYCNILFFDGTKWLTPDTPLLRGTQRQRLIDEQLIGEARITVNDLDRFEKFILVNAMLDFDVQRAKEMSGIRI